MAKNNANERLAELGHEIAILGPLAAMYTERIVAITQDIAEIVGREAPEHRAAIESMVCKMDSSIGDAINGLRELGKMGRDLV